MASGDSAIEIIELTPDPHHNVSDKNISQDEPMEQDVFLPSTPQPKFSRIPAHAHSTPRPPGSLTDSDAYLKTNVFPVNCDTTETPDRRHHEGMNSQTQSKPVVSTCRKQYLFCLALIAISILVGFLAGYFIREKVFEREMVTSSNDQKTSSADKMKQYHQQALGNMSDDGIAAYGSIFSQHKCGSTPCSQSMSAMVAQQLKQMGFSNVDVSSYDVLTSQPDMSQISSLRTLDTDGQQLHMEVLYGSDQDTKQDNGEMQKDDLVNAGDDKAKQSVVTESMDAQTTLMYMPFSASGTVQGELVYTHYATQEDFLILSENRINVTGKIAIARQGTMMVTEQVRNIEEQGMSGLILYTDPSDMATIMTRSTETLVGMSGMMGDPLTPGCPAMDGISRMTMKMAGLPSIPVQPISPGLAERLLGNMTGRMAPNGWQGGLNATYYMGRRNTKKSTWTIELDVSNSMKKQSVQDVVTTITGTQMPDEYIILGGHFPSMMPAMIVPGMTSMTPGHGSTSMMMETASALSSMLADGWRPQRTIKLGIWGGGDVGHAGSMEWMEEHRDILSQRAVSYIDLDSMMGDDGTVKAQASPLLTGVIMKAASMLELSDDIQPGMLNGIGDHVAFSNMLGIPSARLHASHSDMSQMPTPSASQSMYMSVTKLATQTVLLLADSDVIPFDTVAMGDMLMGYVGTLESKMGDVLVLSNMTMDNLKAAVSDFMDESRNMQSMMVDESMMESSVTMMMVNHRLMYMERAFVGMDPSGTMTHILYGMTEKDTFSLVADYSPSNMNNETMTTMMQQVSFIQCSIQSATTLLKMDGS
ncbi:N-acetylated-alpha-linked acidic dipeptidase 2-like [Asterias amurensis]|uniref:N-acetylated-alpha-linked acidic dipeptidase 2-like n=1 Tax=Asterias amurensis TaxID=7602 RepID=UPI003AB38DBE